MPSEQATTSQSIVSRDWTADELALIEATPAKWPRTRKLTDEQVREIRRRTDSLSVAWTAQELAAEYGVQPGQILKIAHRQEWPERMHEPEGRWWKERQIEEMLEG